jgi:pilus assembly protein CpaE
LQDTQISLNKALETIGRDVFWRVPNDYGAMVESRNNGVPLLTYSPKSKLTKEIEKLAHALDGSTLPEFDLDEESKPKKGLFSFLSGSK